jgi:hypothetical protein
LQEKRAEECLLARSAEVIPTDTDFPWLRGEKIRVKAKHFLPGHFICWL